jgi:hypothetical protein
MKKHVLLLLALLAGAALCGCVGTKDLAPGAAPTALILG